MKDKLRRMLSRLAHWWWPLANFDVLMRGIESVNTAMADQLIPALEKLLPIMWDLYDELTLPQLIEAELDDGFLAV